MEGILRQVAISAVPILLAITLHEVAHGLVAYKLGDNTAKGMGRLTLNPLAHIDPFGTVLMPVLLLVLTHGQYVFGYAKPVPINPYNFRNPRKGLALSALAGPVTNFLLALISLLLLIYVLLPLQAQVGERVTLTVLDPVGAMLQKSIWINLILASFNLIPIPPLDGGRVLAGLLPARQAFAFEKLERFGFIIVILLIASGIAYYFITPLMRFFLAVLGLFVKGGIPF